MRRCASATIVAVRALRDRADRGALCRAPSRLRTGELYQTVATAAARGALAVPRREGREGGEGARLGARDPAVSGARRRARPREPRGKAARDAVDARRPERARRRGVGGVRRRDHRREGARAALAEVAAPARHARSVRRQARARRARPPRPSRRSRSAAPRSRRSSTATRSSTSTWATRSRPTCPASCASSARPTTSSARASASASSTAATSCSARSARTPTWSAPSSRKDKDVLGTLHRLVEPAVHRAVDQPPAGPRQAARQGPRRSRPATTRACASTRSTRWRCSSTRPSRRASRRRMTFRWAIIVNQLEHPFGRIAIENPEAPGVMNDLGITSPEVGVPVPADGHKLKMVLKDDSGRAYRGAIRADRAWPAARRSVVRSGGVVYERPSQEGKLRRGRRKIRRRSASIPAGDDRARRHGRGLSRQARNATAGTAIGCSPSRCMRPQLAKESRFVEMFIREGKLAVLLDNDSIVAHLRDRPHRRALLHRDGVHRRQGSDADSPSLPGVEPAHPGAARLLHRGEDARGPALRAHAHRRRRARRSTSSTATCRRRTCASATTARSSCSTSASRRRC